MTNLEFIKKNKTSGIVKDIIQSALFAKPKDEEWTNELISLNWLFSEKKQHGDFNQFIDKNIEWIKETENFFDDLPFDDLPFPLDEEENENV